MAGFLDASLQLVSGFESGLLGCDQAEDHKAIRGHMPQRFKSSRACIVVFEQEALKVGLGKYAGNWFIVTAGVEFALVVPTTNMYSKRDSGMTIDDGIVQFNAEVDEFIRVVSTLAIALAHLGIEESGILGSIDLDVGTA
jgi:hypothetical protein